VDKKQKRRIINIVKKHNDDPEKVAEVIEFVRQNGGLSYATEQMLKYQQEAFEILNGLPNGGQYRTGLEQLVRFTTERKK